MKNTKKEKLSIFRWKSEKKKLFAEANIIWNGFFFCPYNKSNSGPRAFYFQVPRT